MSLTVSWTFWVLFSETLSLVIGPSRTLDFVSLFGQAVGPLRFVPFRWVAFRCQPCFPALALLLWVHFMHSSLWVSFQTGWGHHGLILNASVEFLHVCVTECTVGRHWGLCWFRHSVRSLLQISPHWVSPDFDSQGSVFLYLLGKERLVFQFASLLWHSSAHLGCPRK